MVLGPSTYTAGDVATYVKRQFGDESAVQITDEDIWRWINIGQIEILNKNPILKGRAETNIIVGQYEYTLPVDVLSIQSIRYNGSPLDTMSFQEAEAYILNQDPGRTQKGTPAFWYEWAGLINLYPTPDISLTDGLVIYYVAMPVNVTQTTDILSIPDRYYNTLLHAVLQQAYELDEDWTASGNKANQFESGINNLAEEENNSARAFYPTITILTEDAW
jgi:hypothetical protein